MIFASEEYLPDSDKIVQLNKDIEEGLNDPVIYDGQSAMENLMRKYEYVRTSNCCLQTKVE